VKLSVRAQNYTKSQQHRVPKFTTNKVYTTQTTAIPVGRERDRQGNSR